MALSWQKVNFADNGAGQPAPFRRGNQIQGLYHLYYHDIEDLQLYNRFNWTLLNKTGTNFYTGKPTQGDVVRDTILTNRTGDVNLTAKIPSS